MQPMIPARVKCPDHTWTSEYNGYLMTQSTSDTFFHTEYICVDKEAEVIPDTSESVHSVLLYHVRVDRCGTEYLPCSYDPEKELACVVCSK